MLAVRTPTSLSPNVLALDKPTTCAVPQLVRLWKAHLVTHLPATTPGHG